MARRRYTARGLRTSLRRATRIEGIEETERALAAVGEVAGPEAVSVLVDAGKVGKKEVLDRTPLGPTGNLRKAIFLDASDPFHDPKGPSVLVGINHRIAPHWHFTELGTSRQRATPYFRPGIQAASPEIKRIIESGLKKIIEKAGNG